MDATGYQTMGYSFGMQDMIKCGLYVFTDADAGSS